MMCSVMFVGTRYNTIFALESEVTLVGDCLKNYIEDDVTIQEKRI